MGPKFYRATIRFESGEKRQKVDSALISLVEGAVLAPGALEEVDTVAVEDVAATQQLTQGDQPRTEVVFALQHFSRHGVPALELNFIGQN